MSRQLARRETLSLPAEDARRPPSRSGGVRLAARRLAILTSAAACGALVVYTVAGEHIVRAVHDGYLTPLLGHLLEGRSVHAAEHYHDALGRRMPYAITTAGAVVLALLCVSLGWPQLPAVILALDLLLIAVDRSFGILGLYVGRTPWSVNLDRGYPEIFQYLKETGVAAGLLGLYVRTRAPVYLAWAGTALYLLLDDALEIHERLGREATTRLQLADTLGLRAGAIGEVLVAGAIGAVLLIALAIVYRRAAPAEQRASRSLLALFGLLAFFGVAVDAVATGSLWAEFWEDAAEMVAMSLIVWYIYARWAES